MKYIAISLFFVAASVRASQSVYGQCGGIGWAGPTTCASGSVCSYSNDYYSQCVPGTATSDASSCGAPTSSSASAAAATAATGSEAVSAQTAALYGQCGGTGWTGATTCASGSVCTYNNDYYSQCLPETTVTTAKLSTSTPKTSTAKPSMTTVRSSSVVPTTTVKASSTSSATPVKVSSTTVEVSTVTSSATPVKVSSTVAASSVTTVKASSATTKASSTTVKTSAAAAATATSSSGTLGPLGGVNTAGYDFSVYTDGSFSGTGIPPPTSQYAHFASQGANIFRIPFAWQLMTPTLGGSIDETWFATFDATVQAALSASTSPYVILDLHNYARWNGGIVGQGGPTNDQFANLWSQIATKYASNSKIIFGIMNEPHDLPSLSDWAASVQAAINAVRAAGATTQYILMPGSSYSNAATLPTEAGPSLAALTDPAGGVSKLLFDVHRYLDSDNSGTSTECVTDNVDVLTTLVAWLKSVGNRQAILSETGGGNTASCETYLDSELAYVKANSASIAGFTVWAAGSFDTTYALTVTPNSDGSDQPLWTDAVVPNLP